MVKKSKMVCVILALLLALTVCTGAALAYCQPEAVSAIAAEGIEPLYCHGKGRHGGHHGGHGHHGSAETCDWLFHACGDCVDVNCEEEDHAHRCPTDCTNKDHRHYGVCHYADGTLELIRKRA